MILLSLKQRGWRWIVLFVGAVGLAIALSHTLNSQRFMTADQTSSAPTELMEAIAPSSWQPQLKYDRNLIHYATVSRSDGSFRQMFVEKSVIDILQPGEPLPDNTLIVMETWYSPENVGTVFVKQKQDGEWLYGSFEPAQPNYQMSFSGSCHRCHAPFPNTDFTLTKPLLEAALQTQQVQMAFCDRPGRTPCEPVTYVPAS
jgi:hypothetical protein